MLLAGRSTICSSRSGTQNGLKNQGSSTPGALSCSLALSSVLRSSISFWDLSTQVRSGKWCNMISMESGFSDLKNQCNPAEQDFRSMDPEVVLCRHCSSLFNISKPRRLPQRGGTKDQEPTQTQQICFKWRITIHQCIWILNNKHPDKPTNLSGWWGLGFTKAEVHLEFFQWISVTGLSHHHPDQNWRCQAYGGKKSLEKRWAIDLDTNDICRFFTHLLPRVR